MEGRRRASGRRRAGRPPLAEEAEALQVFPLSTKQTSQQTSLLNSLISGDSGSPRLAPSIPHGRSSSPAGVLSTRRPTESEEPPGTELPHGTSRTVAENGLVEVGAAVVVPSAAACCVGG